VTAFFTLLGGNEFGDYQPMLFIDPTKPIGDQAPPPPLLGSAPIPLEAHEVKNGFFREDEIHEASIDLEAITRYPSADAMATPFEVIEHLSSASTVGLENVPQNDVTPSMVRFQFALSADGLVVVDYSVRVRDHSGKLAGPTDKNLYVSAAAMLTPPAVPPMTMTAP
jgi:hypothetical protein